MSDVNKYLKTADLEQSKGNIEEALALYHKVFKSATTLAIKEKALKGTII